MTLQASYYREESNLARIEVDFDYNDDEEHHARFESEIKDLSAAVGYKNYSVSVKGTHKVSELELTFDGSVGLKPNKYKIEATGFYKRGYLPEAELEMVSFVDIDRREIKVYVSSKKLK